MSAELSVASSPPLFYFSRSAIAKANIVTGRARRAQRTMVLQTSLDKSYHCQACEPCRKAVAPKWPLHVPAAAHLIHHPTHAQLPGASMTANRIWNALLPGSMVLDIMRDAHVSVRRCVNSAATVRVVVTE
jgi:hypothetical protein